MVAPVVAGAAIGAGASLLGGMMTDRANRRTARENLAYQREFAQKGIQWRVEDAKAAGLHPLFALGAQTPSYSPAQTVGSGVGKSLSEAGQAIGNAVARQQTAEQQQLAAAQLRLLQAQANSEDERAFGMFLDNARKVQDQQPQQSPGNLVDPRFVYGAAGVPGGGVGQVQVKPSEVYSSAPSDRSMEAGTGTFWKSWNVTKDGRIVATPSKDLAELLESTGESPLAALMILKKNLSQNPNFLLENQDWIPFAREINTLQRGFSQMGDFGSWLYDKYTDPDSFGSPAFRSRSAPWKNRSGQWSYPARK